MVLSFARSYKAAEILQSVSRKFVKHGERFVYRKLHKVRLR